METYEGTLKKILEIPKFTSKNTLSHTRESSGRREAGRAVYFAPFGAFGRAVCIGWQTLQQAGINLGVWAGGASGSVHGAGRVATPNIF